jgi:hypothetical protein
LGDRIHFWPFDGWDIPNGKSVIVEAYPSLWSRNFMCEGRTSDQHDAYSIAAWMQKSDSDGSLPDYFKPNLTSEERKTANIEGWILGVKSIGDCHEKICRCMAKKKNDTDTKDDLSKGEVLVYQTEDGRIKLDVRLEGETVWLSQQLIAELFQTTVPNISMHIRNIYDEGELNSEATVKKFLTVRREGDREVRRELDFFNLDMIISIGYRVKSLIATRFRIWATQQLKEYIVKGFTMDDERLKNPRMKDSQVPDYFDEMLARIRDIRAGAPF